MRGQLSIMQRLTAAKTAGEQLAIADWNAEGSVPLQQAFDWADEAYEDAAAEIIDRQNFGPEQRDILRNGFIASYLATVARYAIIALGEKVR